MEQIGNVKIDDTYYPGEDLYCDGAVEDELLEIVQTKGNEEFSKVIEERGDWPIFYHLSKERQNIVEWLPIDKSMKVLEVGSGCGAITGVLSKKAGKVDCIELSKKRSLINANRNKECENVTIQLGNFKEIEPQLECDYDYILLIGVFEYANGYMGTQNPYVDFMSILKKHLSPNGRLVIAIENQFGLKYWAGCREDHLGTYFSGLEGYVENKGVKTFTKQGLEKILQTNGIEQYSFYYPYPDYKFMSMLYSDGYLPKEGELSLNECNYDRDRVALFNENLVFDSIIREQQFPLFSNSYMVVTGPKLPIKYSKYSSEREDKYQIRTDMIQEETGLMVVQKTALQKESMAHILKMQESYKLLEKRYEGSSLYFNKIVGCDTKGQLQFEYIKGGSLESYFDELLKNGKKEEFVELFKKYYELISYNNGVDITNIDVIFSNILICEDKWTVIDYEWTVEEVMESKNLAYRAFYCYTLGGTYRQNQVDDLILEVLGLSKVEAEALQLEEIKFQKSINGGHLVKAQIRDLIGNTVFTMEDMSKQVEPNEMKIQIYEDLGKGFMEEKSYFLGQSKIGQNEVEISVDKEVKNLRFDPFMCECVVEIMNMEWNQHDCLSLLQNAKNSGVSVGKNKFFFDTKDPNISICLKKLKKEESNLLKIQYKLQRMV